MIRVLVVDDSAFLRRQLTRALESEGDIAVVGQACDGLEAQAMAAKLKPDVITMDVEMPRCNGLEALRAILAQQAVAVLMISSLTRAGADTTVEALRSGAVDFLHKGSNGTAMEWSANSDTLREKVRFWANYNAPTRTLVKPAAAPVIDAELLLIGCSSGGPKALSQLFDGVGRLSVPTVIAQHMPPVYTQSLAATLDRLTANTVREAASGERLQAGEVWLVPGGQHGRLRRDGQAWRLDCDPAPEGEAAPSVNRLLKSAAQQHGRVLALVLSGMGRDGAQGAEVLRAQEQPIWVQDPADCVVAGMPGAVLKKRLQPEVLSIAQMREALIKTTLGR
jgi:two-component system chemotaxis response regulator CheB